ncbi:hypothetical protein GCM10011331_14480 [Flavimobilis marinus]|uniref:Tetratricopeptide repeat-containing protein n=1 Tax=Flavimobilis marinus TaxID=285351 RepID=A0A1I2FTA6_9MICO|nr:hypothetical protein [Flavimobilis marinus]GHG51174.1 hypothetical protein GCM10011331_14480 [Flavimobilis marinus]SFF08652.1 hypothetical protein SAMN04488035_1516 [Flavimobilis marinus]
MALLPKLRQLIKRPVSASTVGVRRPTAGPRRGDAPHEDALRAMLNDDPNNIKAFQALVEIVRRRAAETGETEDPLTAPHPDETYEADRKRRGDLAVWALAEELAGHPRAWYPLVELARLSLDDDKEGAVRRLATAAERDTSGIALSEAVGVLREAEMPVDALGLGLGHWRAREHNPEVGRQLVLAAIEAGRPFEARHHLDSLGLHPDASAVAAIRTELEPHVKAAEDASPGSVHP